MRFAAPWRVFIAAAVLHGTAATGADWISYCGDAAHTCRGPDVSGIEDLVPRWAVQLETGINAPPVAAGNVVYAVDREGTVHALRRIDGFRLWTEPLGFPGGATAAPAIRGDRLVVVGRSSARVVALDVARPNVDVGSRVLWSRAFPGEDASAAPVADARHVYVATRDSSDCGRVRAFELATGDQAWSSTTAAPVGPAPALASDGTFVLAGERCNDDPLVLEAFDVNDAGALLWTVELGSAGPAPVSSVAVDETRGNALVVTGRTVRAFGLATGEPAWTGDLPAPLDGGVVPVRTGGPGIGTDTAFVTDPSDGGHLTAFAAASGAKRWIAAIPGGSAGPPVVGTGNLLATGSDGILRLFDAASGSLAGALPLPGRPTGPPAVAGETIYATLDSGLVVALGLP